MLNCKIGILFLILFFLSQSSNGNPIWINEVMADNEQTIADNNGEYDDWIELYNSSNSAINIADYYISDDLANLTKWQIPNTNTAATTIVSNGFLILWADEDTEQGITHIDFKLSNGGETIYLIAPDGITIVSTITFPSLSTDSSFGRMSDGGNTLVQFTTPSPIISNINSSAQIGTPNISLPTGKYTGSQTVNISAESGAIIYYTTDGTIPSAASTPYTTPIQIDTSQSIRAIAVKPGFVESEAITNTYLLNPTTSLPILHVTIDPKYLWDDSLGMYVVGTNGRNWYCWDQSRPENWNQDWEYPATLTLIEKDGSLGFSEDCGISISGGCSRNAEKKSFNVGFKKEFGKGKLKYKLFENQPYTEWQGLKIRSGGSQRKERRINGALFQTYIENQLDIDGQSARPVALYLNGQYWGLYNIRDRVNKQFVKTKYPKIDADSIDFIKFPLGDGSEAYWFIEDVKKGTNTDYHAMHSFVQNNDLSIASNYDYIKTKIDISSLQDFLAVTFYCRKRDWPANNIKVWRPNNGKWRWILFDDDTFNRDEDSYKFTDRFIKLFEDHKGWFNTTDVNPYFQLFDNQKFRDEFLQKINTYTHTVWQSERIDSINNVMIQEVENEIQADYERWNGTLWNDDVVESWDLTTWQAQLHEFYDFFPNRKPYWDTEVRNALNISTDSFQLNINFDTKTKGVVRLHSNYHKIPYNFSAYYYKDIKMNIHAIPKPGYRFVRWEETGITNANLYQSFNANTTLTPIFEVAEDVVINEIHYHSNDTIVDKEFIEIYNPDNQVRDLSGYQFTEGVCFEFPKGTTIEGEEYIVIAADASQYQGNGYQVFEWESGSLNNDGEEIILINSTSQVIDSVAYNDSDQWPLLADGWGSSLELKYPLPTDNFLPTDWQHSVPTDGTPGTQNSTICNNSASIVINEINYNSDNETFDPSDWVELYNSTNSTINLSGWALYDSENTFTIPNGTTIAANQYIVLVEDQTGFTAAFPNVPNVSIIGNLGFSFSEKGERIALFDTNNCLEDQVIYNDKSPWPNTPDGEGETLSLIHTELDNAHAVHWEASAILSSYYEYGSPGKANYCFGVDNNIIGSQVRNSADDAEEKHSDGSVKLTSKDLDLVDDGDVFTVGIRFQDIRIPQNATITSAVLQFSADETDTDTTILEIRGQAIDDAPTFTTTTNNITNRAVTSSSVFWYPDPWNRIGENGVTQMSIDLSPIIQEIVDRPGFISGNAIALLFEGTGSRTAKSYDGMPEQAPKLVITYTENNCGVHAKLLLEGFYDATTDQMHSKLVTKNLLPLTQPFNTAPWYYDGTESVNALPANVTDWILVATRNEQGAIVKRAAGFINQKGELLDLNSQKGIPLIGAMGQRFSIHPRAHLAILSAQPYSDQLYDFTLSSNQVQGVKQLKFKAGKYVLYAGDYDSSGIINNIDFNNWKLQSAILNKYLSIDGDGNGIINSIDYNLWINNRSKIGEQIIRY